jgi:hypothetical protein
MIYITCNEERQKLNNHEASARKNIAKFFVDNEAQINQIAHSSNSSVDEAQIKRWLLVNYLSNGKRLDLLSSALDAQRSFSIDEADTAYAEHIGKYYPRNSVYEIINSKLFNMVKVEEADGVGSNAFKPITNAVFDGWFGIEKDHELSARLDRLHFNKRNISGVNIGQKDDFLIFTDLTVNDNNKQKDQVARLTHVYDFILDWKKNEPELFEGRKLVVHGINIEMSKELINMWNSAKESQDLNLMKTIKDLAKSIGHSCKESGGSVTGFANISRVKFNPSMDLSTTTAVREGLHKMNSYLEQGVAPERNQKDSISSSVSFKSLNNTARERFNKLSNEVAALTVLRKEAEAKYMSKQSDLKNFVDEYNLPAGILSNKVVTLQEKHKLSPDKARNFFSDLGVSPEQYGQPVYDTELLLSYALSNGRNNSDFIAEYTVDKKMVEVLAKEMGIDFNKALCERTTQVIKARETRGDKFRSVSDLDDTVELIVSNAVNETIASEALQSMSSQKVTLEAHNVSNSSSTQIANNKTQSIGM